MKLPKRPDPGEKESRIWKRLPPTKPGDAGKPAAPKRPDPGESETRRK